jgi:hypothetical protein
MSYLLFTKWTPINLSCGWLTNHMLEKAVNNVEVLHQIFPNSEQSDTALLNYLNEYLLSFNKIMSILLNANYRYFRVEEFYSDLPISFPGPIVLTVMEFDNQTTYNTITNLIDWNNYVQNRNLILDLLNIKMDSKHLNISDLSYFDQLNSMTFDSLKTMHDSLKNFEKQIVYSTGLNN